MFRLLKSLGPGLIYAGAAIGVSHLVQSTRAGALYSFELVVFVLLANILKLPFLEMAQRFPSVTGKSLLHGYKSMGNGYLLFFLLITVLTMFIILGAIIIVTAGITIMNLSFDSDPLKMSYFLLIFCTLFLFSGKYSFLDNFIKYTIIFLSLAVMISFGVAARDFNFSNSSFIFNEFQFDRKSDLLFLAALIGWMPAPLDISVWHSLWTCEKLKWKKADKKSSRSGFIDFYIGYIGTAILALLFLALGAMVMFPTGQRFEGSAVAFSGQLVSLFSKNLGEWSRWLIAFACWATMFSTSMTCLDAFSRLMAKGKQLLFEAKEVGRLDYSFSLALIAIGTGVFLKVFLKDMRAMVDFATSASFIVTPVIAWMNYKLFRRYIYQKEKVFLKFLDCLSKFGIAFFSLFVVFYLLLTK